MDVYTKAQFYIKTVEYTLTFSFHKDGISWVHTSHGPFSYNSGSWKLIPTKDGMTEATYTVNTSFNVWVPEFLKDFIIRKSLPSTMAAFKKRIEECKNLQL